MTTRAGTPRSRATMAKKVANCSGVALWSKVTASITSDSDVPPVVTPFGGVAVVVGVVLPALVAARGEAGLVLGARVGSTRRSSVWRADIAACRNATDAAGRSPVRLDKNRKAVVIAADESAGTARSGAAPVLPTV